jgi:hypothetical protein
MVASGETSERQAPGGDRRTQQVGQHSPGEDQPDRSGTEQQPE